MFSGSTRSYLVYTKRISGSVVRKGLMGDGHKSSPGGCSPFPFLSFFIISFVYSMYSNSSVIHSLLPLALASSACGNLLMQRPLTVISHPDARARAARRRPHCIRKFLPLKPHDLSRSLLHSSVRRLPTRTPMRFCCMPSMRYFISYPPFAESVSNPLR